MRKQNVLKIFAVAALLIAGAAAARTDSASYAAETETAAEAVPDVSPVMINKTTVTFPTYTISGDVYFRLRDIAKSFMGTSKSISVTEDTADNVLELKSNEYYSEIGNELGPEPAAETVSAARDTRTILYDGSAAGISGYDINGEIYFTLSDLRSMMNFTLGTDEASGQESISTGTPWTPVTSINFSAQQDVMIRNGDGTLVSMTEPYFTSKLVAPGTWQIQSDGDYMYLVEGDDEAVLIDSGYGAGNIRAYCETLTSRPLNYVINTHYHFDHTANDAYFDCTYMSADTAAQATVPYPSFAGINFPRDYPVVIVSDGYTFDLGNRTLEVLEIPNHTAGGTALLDRTNRILFSGDEIMRADSLSLNCSVEQFEQNMEKLEAVRGEFDQCFGGPGVVDAGAIDHFLACSRYILAGGTPDPAAGGNGQGGSGQWNHSQDTSADSGQTIYGRGSVRTPDKGPAADNTYQVKTTYSNCTLMYDSRKITNDEAAAL